MPQFLVFLLVALSVLAPSNYATDQAGAVTPFKMANQYGTLSFMAHNNLAGAYIDDLAKGDDILLIYDGYNKTYEVTELIRYDAKSPLSVYSDFRPYGGGKWITVERLFLMIYGVRDGRLVLQTCYDGSNGRLFVIAYPKDEQ